jgi:hypothetical protein
VRSSSPSTGRAALSPHVEALWASALRPGGVQHLASPAEESCYKLVLAIRSFLSGPRAGKSIHLFVPNSALPAHFSPGEAQRGLVAATKAQCFNPCGLSGGDVAGITPRPGCHKAGLGIRGEGFGTAHAPSTPVGTDPKTMPRAFSRE